MTAQRSIKESKGFTLVELLLGLAISSMLLAAVAAAFNASVMNYRENRQIYQTLNSARQALLRMTTQLRTGNLVEPAAPANQCSFHTAADDDITYEYRSADHRLVLITNDDNEEYVLCENVTGATFTKTATDAGGDCKSVQISITVQIGDQVQTLSSAAVIRRNLEL
jgi:prepilin-type N-terminal cleavage/methylation domain-containing protein